jgi:hypothetical protein
VEHPKTNDSKGQGALHMLSRLHQERQCFAHFARLQAFIITSLRASATKVKAQP